MSPVRYELGFYIPEDAIRHSHRRAILRSNIDLNIDHETCVSNYTKSVTNLLYLCKCIFILIDFLFTCVLHD
jgi:hypothetical protein